MHSLRTAATVLTTLGLAAGGLPGCAGPPEPTADARPVTMTMSAGAVGRWQQGPVSTRPAARAAAPPTCGQLAASLTRTEQVGQLFMIGVSSAGLSPVNGRVLRTSRAGSVVLLGNSGAGAARVRKLVKSLRAASGAPTAVSMLLTVDQEGGKVQRLQGPGFDRMPSARSQAKMSNATLRRKARRWGRQLRSAGIDANLAPVADVVPTNLRRLNLPIGALDRGFGHRPRVVAANAAAVVHGMDSAGVATAVKHFPGLGRVRGNTDYEAHVVDSITTRHDAALAGFSAGITAGTDMVMVSSAYYRRIDAVHRAAFSKIVIGQLVRRDQRFAGVVISDDLGTRALRSVSPGDRALRFLLAGGDLIIVGDPGQVSAMTRAVAARAKASPGFALNLRHKVTSVLAMKARRGLAGCR